MFDPGGRLPVVHFLICRAGSPGYRVRAGAKGRDLSGEQELLFCSTRAFKRSGCFQRGEEAVRRRLRNNRTVGLLQDWFPNGPEDHWCH